MYQPGDRVETLASLNPPSSQLLISEKKNLIGYYDQNTQKLYLSSFRSERYVRENWTRILGLSKEDTLRLTEHPSVTCDQQGCRFRIEDINISVSDNSYALREDCRWADVIISEGYISRSCKVETILDRKKKNRNGSTRIQFENGEYILLSVSESRGQRPWTNQYQ